MDNSLIDIVKITSYYKELVLERDRLLEEYETWQTLYDEVKVVLDQSKVLYEKTKSEKDKEEYEKWVKESEAYLELLCEYSLKFENINEELNTYDKETMEKQVDYLADLTRFDDITKELKIIQKESLKASDIIVLENAEGRKKKISSAYAEKYQSLVEEKKLLAKNIKHKGKIIFKKKKVEEQKEEIHEYELLSIGEKIKLLEAKISEIKQAPGEKSKINYFDEEVIVPSAYLSQYYLCANELRNLRQHLLNENVKVFNTHNKLFYDALELEVPKQKFNIEENCREDLVYKYGEKYEELSVQEKIQILNDKMQEFEKADGEKIRVNSFGINVLIPAEHKVRYYICANELRLLNNHLKDSSYPLREGRDYLLYEALTTPVSTLEYELSENIKEIQEEMSEEEEKAKQFDLMVAPMIKIVNDNYEAKKIVKKEKSKNKENLIKKLKKAGLVIATTALVALSASSIFNALNAKKKQDEPKKDNYETMQDIELDDNNIKDEDINNIVDSIIDEENKVESEIEEENVIKLGDTFFINGNANIYRNVEDLKNDVNGLKPYFENDKLRTIGGIEVTYEGNSYFFYSYTQDAQENIDMLLANGGSISAVLAANENGYEGFYSINDIVVLSNTLGGKSR